MRILLGIVLALSVSFACDQPHEEVGGYKIGCPFDGKAKLTKKGVVSKYSSELKDGFFDNALLETLNGELEVLSFIKNYDTLEALHEEREVALDTLKARWGEYTEKKIDGHPDFTVYTFKDTNNHVIDRVMLAVIRSQNTATLSASYISRKMSAYHDEQEAERRKNTSNSLKGF